MKKIKRISLRVLFGLALLYLILLIPDFKADSLVIHTAHRPFAWDKDSVWAKLEKEFSAARSMQPSQLDSSLEILKVKAQTQFAVLEPGKALVNDPQFDSIQHTFFRLATLVAVKPAEL